MSDFISVTVRGVRKFTAATEEVERNVDFATIKGLKAQQTLVKREVRKNLRGAPRWTERGKSKIYSTTWRITPGGNTNNPRSGGPGKFSGALLGGVGGVRRPKKLLDVFIGGVGVGGNVNNLKKHTLEREFPYFKPAVEKAEPKMSKVWEKAWGNAVERRGGLL